MELLDWLVGDGEELSVGVGTWNETNIMLLLSKIQWKQWYCFPFVFVHARCFRIKESIAHFVWVICKYDV